MKYSIRTARKSDSSAMYYISVDAHSKSYYNQLIPDENVKDFLKKYHATWFRRWKFVMNMRRSIGASGFRVFVAVIDAKIVGYAVALLVEQETVICKGLFVDPKYHHRGIGSGLLEAIIQIAGNHSVIELTVLSQNEVAKQLYEKYGFKYIRRSQKAFFGAEQEIMQRQAVGD